MHQISNIILLLTFLSKITLCYVEIFYFIIYKQQMSKVTFNKSKQQKSNSNSKNNPNFIQISKEQLLFINNSQKLHNIYNQLKDKQQWKLDGQKSITKQQQYQIFLQNIYSTKMQALNLIDFNSSTAIRIILHPIYLSLKVLKLANNCINSIQNISFLNSPNLIELNLAQNHIVSLQPLVKFKTLNLLGLIIRKNNVIDSENFNKHFTRVLLGQQQKKIFKQLIIESKLLVGENNYYKSIQCEDLSKLIKIMPEFFATIKFVYENRIEQPFVFKCRRRKNQANKNQNNIMLVNNMD